mmetsp:Transcript_53454/g.98880  ORF Transcript_53454/g.98880 Transcript_53454/m.98880 type:complete len:340 (-) Transcript_53454:18-1037(-)
MIPFLLMIVQYPYVVLAIVCGVVLLCLWCARWELRDWPCIKCLLRCIRYDSFDDFVLRVMVHEASYGRLKQRMYVKITAGRRNVKTDPSPKGKFHQKMDILVAQGTSTVKFDLVDHARGNVLAQLKLDPVRDILQATGLCEERVYKMGARHKDVVMPKLTLTMFMDVEGDEETPLISDGSSDMNILLHQHISKVAKKDHADHGNAVFSEIETLREAGSNPAELFRGIRKTESVYLAILGPPASRRWTLGLWSDIKEFQSKKPGLMYVDMLRIRSIQPDAVRTNIFTVHYFDDAKVAQQLTIRSIEINRDVWVEILSRLVQIAHAQHRELHDMRSKPRRI